MSARLSLALIGSLSAVLLSLSVHHGPRLIGLGCQAFPVEWADEEDQFAGKCNVITKWRV
jgi:hypothetical protein